MHLWLMREHLSLPATQRYGVGRRDLTQILNFMLQSLSLYRLMLTLCCNQFERRILS